MYYFKQKKIICVFITLGKNSVFRIKELKVVNANKIINMLPYTKVKKQKTNLDIQYVNLNHIKKNFGL